MASTIVGLDFGRGVIRAAEVQGFATARPTLVRYHQIQVPITAIDRGDVVDDDGVAVNAEVVRKHHDAVLGGLDRRLTQPRRVPRPDRVSGHSEEVLHRDRDAFEEARLAYRFNNEMMAELDRSHPLPRTPDHAS